MEAEMATQRVPALQFPSQPSPQVVPQAEIITQDELTLLLSLRSRLHQLEEQVETAEKSIRTRLEAEVSVQPGDHIAKLAEHFRASVAWKDKAIDLAERLGLNGPAWAQNVLTHTSKTRTVSLFIE
jgi:hypothetical protein